MPAEQKWLTRIVPVMEQLYISNVHQWKRSAEHKRPAKAMRSAETVELP